MKPALNDLLELVGAPQKGLGAMRPREHTSVSRGLVKVLGNCKIIQPAPSSTRSNQLDYESSAVRSTMPALSCSPRQWHWASNHHLHHHHCNKLVGVSLVQKEDAEGAGCVECSAMTSPAS